MSARITREPRTSRARRGAAGSLAAAFALALAACAAPGTGAGTDPEGTDTATAVAPEDAAPSDNPVYAAPATLIQQGDDAPQACFGGVADSLPPQCGGPVLVGLDWDDVADAETVAGVTFGSGWLVGTYDGERFTLTEPVRDDAPEDLPAFDADSPSWDPLCEDPYRGGSPDAYTTETFPEGEALGPEGQTAMATLQERIFALPGYVETFVSDGFSEINVLLEEGSDVEAAHASLREVWAGWLCLGTADVPTQAEGQEASQALSDAAEGLDLLSWNADTLEGRFSVWVLLDDEATLAAIHEALAPWYSPDRIDVTSALRRVDG